MNSFKNATLEAAAPGAVRFPAAREEQYLTDRGRAGGVWQPADGPRTSTILVPISGAWPSPASLALAVRLAHASNGGLVLMHAAQLNIAGEEHGIRRSNLLRDLLHEAEVRLTGLADSLRPYIRTEVVVREGVPAEAILETAKYFHADAIVMQKPSRPWFSRLAREHPALRWVDGCLGWFYRLRGDNTWRVARQSTCPVYVVSSSENELNCQG